MNRWASTFLALACLVVTCEAVANEADTRDIASRSRAEVAHHFVPASFAKGGSPSELVAFPEVAGNVDLRILCGGAVSPGRAADGGMTRFSYVWCFAKDARQAKFVKAIYASILKSRLTCARIGGRPTGVWFQFSVYFHKDAKHREILVFPNHGLNVGNYGLEYTAPQRFHSGPRLTCGKEFLFVEMVIDTNGAVARARPLGSGVSGQCRRGISNARQVDRYIPAMSKGTAVSAKYVQEYYTGAKAYGVWERDPSANVLDLDNPFRRTWEYF